MQAVGGLRYDDFNHPFPQQSEWRELIAAGQYGLAPCRARIQADRSAFPVHQLQRDVSAELGRSVLVFDCDDPDLEAGKVQEL